MDDKLRWYPAFQGLVSRVETKHYEFSDYAIQIIAVI